MEEQELLLNQAKIFYRKGKYERALQYVTNLLQSDQHNAQLLSLSAMCKAKQGKLPDAEREASSAQGVDPKSGFAHCATAVIRAAQKKGKDAEAEFAGALSLSPSDAFIYLERAQFYKSAGKVAEAAADFEKAASLDPSLKEASDEAAALKKSIPPPPSIGAVKKDTDTTEISNEWLTAKVPKGWGVEARDKSYCLRSDENPAVTIIITIIPGDKTQISGMADGFYPFVEGEAKRKPYKISTRRMRAGSAKEAHALMGEGKDKSHCVFIGYPGVQAFYLVEFSAPESAPASLISGFDAFLASIVPAGMVPDAEKPGAAAQAGPASAMSLAISAILALLGLAIIAGGAYLLFTAPGLTKLDAPFATTLALAIIGFLLIANAVFKMSPKLIFMLNFIFIILNAILAIFAYLAFSSSSLVIIGSSTQGGTVLAGAAAQALSILLLALSTLSIIACAVIFLYSKMKHVELEDAYLELYSKAAGKLARK